MKGGVVYTTIALSGSISDAVGIANATKVGLLLHVPTSCQVYLRGATSANSVHAKRVMDTDGTSSFVINGAASIQAIDITDRVAAFPYLRLETSVAQSAVASFSIVFKP